MNYIEFTEIKENIKAISKFNLEYYKLFYNYFKNKNQIIKIRIDEKKFLKLFKNYEVLCEDIEYKRLLKKYGIAELIKIYDTDIVITTLLHNIDNGINKLKKFNKLKILKRR